MTNKYLSLILNAVAVAVLLMGTVGVARQSALANKRVSLGNVQALTAVDPATMEGYKMLGSGLAVFDQITKAHPAPVSESAATTPPSNGAVTAAASVKTIFAGSQGGKIENQGKPLSVAVMRYGLANSTDTKNKTTSSKKKVVAQTAEKKIALPVVNVVIQAGKSGKAMIDGSIVGVSDKLASGYVVKNIAMDLVTLAKDNEEIELKVPLDRLRVLGAQQAIREKRSD